MKQCHTCKESKPNERFYKRPNIKSGRDNVCIDCRNKRQKELESTRKTILGGKDWLKMVIG